MNRRANDGNREPAAYEAACAVALGLPELGRRPRVAAAVDGQRFGGSLALPVVWPALISRSHRPP